jgi:hypothetical protein
MTAGLLPFSIVTYSARQTEPSLSLSKMMLHLSTSGPKVDIYQARLPRRRISSVPRGWKSPIKTIKLCYRAEAFNRPGRAVKFVWHII